MRVWTESGLKDHGHTKVNVPAMTAGTITEAAKQYVTMDVFLYTVEWDTGQRSIHYYNTLLSIGKSRSYAEFQEFVVQEAARAEIYRGPNGGHRGSKVFLKNGDWVGGMYGVAQRLEAEGIPVETIQLKRKSRHGP